MENGIAKIAYSVSEAVAVSGLGRSFLYEHIATGLLRSKKVGTRRLIMHNDLIAFLNGEHPDNNG